MMRSHIHTAVTYLKHFSSNPNKGRKSIVHVYNKKLHLEQNLTVDNIGIKIGSFSKEVEEFHEKFEREYNKFMDLMSIRYPPRIAKEKLKIGMMMIFNLVLRSKINYEYIQKSFKNYPDLIRKYGENPWHSPEAISYLQFKLLLKRRYPISIRRFPDEVFITGDNPVVIFRHPYGIGTIYILTLDRKHVFCLGYYLKERELRFLEIYINNAKVIPENINVWIKFQADTHYII